MATFHDAKNDQWPIEITYGDIKRLRRAPLGSNGDCGVDLLTITEAYDAETKQPKPPLSIRLESDYCLLIDVVFCLVQDVAEKRGISDEEFGRLISPSVLIKMREAFWEAVRDFFQEFPRGDVNATLNRQLAAWADLGEQQLLQEAAALEWTSKVVKKNTPTEEEAIANLERVIGIGSSSNGPASQASTPATTAPEN